MIYFKQQNNIPKYLVSGFIDRNISKNSTASIALRCNDCNEVVFQNQNNYKEFIRNLHDAGIF